MNVGQCWFQHMRVNGIWVLNQKYGFLPPKSSISIGFSIINHPFWGIPIFGNTHMGILICSD